MRKYVVILTMLLAVMLPPVLSRAEESAAKTLMMATTTSTDDTGLLDYLAPFLLKDTGIDLKWTATGTGKALELGKNCDVSVLLVHAPESEKKYVSDGYGVERREVMYNDFIIIGPAADPAGIKGKTAAEALATLRDRKAAFVSRGDNSGTHQQELVLWKAAAATVPDRESWYVQTGQGMLATINIAAEKNGYTLTDRGTYIKYGAAAGGSPALAILVEGDARLKNQYSVMAVNPGKCPGVDIDGARVFAAWMAGPTGQKLINDFRLMGQQLFFANAL
ncbi:MAG: substrate-binding domain-containing protein [Thermodesulfobacteriota bacterium]